MESMDHTIDALAKEINRNIKAMSKSRSIDEKKTQAEIVKLLCESLGVFFSAMAEAHSGYDDECDDDFYRADHYDEDDEYYDDEDADDYEEGMTKDKSLKKGKKGKKNDKDDIPF